MRAPTTRPSAGNSGVIARKPEYLPLLLRPDNLAQCYCQVLLAMEVPVPDDLSL